MGKEFKPLFGSYDFIATTYINFGTNPLDLYATGYRLAAEKLGEHVLYGGGERDIDRVIYPIVFLYRHYLELRLKEIVRQGKELLGEGGDFRMGSDGHKLHILWEDAVAIMLKIEGHPADEFEVCKHVVESFREDPKATEFRYPEDKKRNNSLEYVKEIDLNHLRKTFEVVSEFLDRVSGMIEDYKSNMGNY